MGSILAFISSYVSYWPLVCIVALLLAGFNLPISEDVLIVMSALIATKDRGTLVPNYIALYIGIYLSDMISYWFGRLCGKGVLSFKFVTKSLTPERISKISGKLEKHGLLTFIITRFIPFGVRNALFMTCGFTCLPFLKFILFDSVAVLLSSSTLYWLVLLIGERGGRAFKTAGVVLFILVWLFFLVMLIRFLLLRNKKPAPKGPVSASEEK